MPSLVLGVDFSLIWKDIEFASAYYFAVDVELKRIRMHVMGCVFVVYLAVLVFELHRSALAHDEYVGNYSEANIVQSLKRERKLSRQRRYLEFPEGSSFQFVYDVVVAVVGNVNYITVSITVALAWALPSEPPSEILEDLTDRLKDGTLGIARNDSVSHVTYSDVRAKSTQHQAYRHPAQNYDDIVRNTHTSNGDRVKSNTHIYTSTRSNTFPTQWKYTPEEEKYQWWRLEDHERETDRQKKPIDHAQRHYEHVSRPLVRRRPRDHFIFPIFGKHTGQIARGTAHSRVRRSGITADNPTKVDRIHIRHQRRSRHDLYNAIEKYLDRKSIKGHYCVLRAICETAQKSDEREPGSFVGELMRAMFTMPEPLERDHHWGHRERRYDAAQTLKGDCSQHFHDCEHSLWSSSFVS